MKYVFYENGISLKDTICQINNVEPSSLDVSDFKVDDLKVLNDFKDHLLSLKDKRFFIVGDYDCDGICATAIMALMSCFVWITASLPMNSCAMPEKEACIP